MNLPGKYNTVQAELKENKIERELLIESLKYLPKFYQDQSLFKEASWLLDACLSEDTDILKEIHQAYCDTLYKISAYQQLSFAAKKELLKEKGFEYVLNLLKHIYEERYNQLPDWKKKLQTVDEYLEENTKDNLANLTMLFNLIYILKGKTLGLELALELVNCPDFIYLPWDIVSNYKGKKDSYEDLPLPGEEDVEAGDVYTVQEGAIEQEYIFNGVAWHKCTTYKDYLTPRQPFTADLTIWGTASSSLQANIAKFVRSYMLPFVEIKLKFTDNMDPIYCYPSGDRSLLRSYNLVHYYENGKLIKHDLEHTVSDNGWRDSDTFDLPITIGQPIYNENGFKGEVNLPSSYVESNGVKHYLYGKSKTIPDFITGPALDSLTEDGKVYFDGDYINVPLQDMDYILVDIETGNQNNPYWDEDTFYRDPIIKFNKHLTVGGIHLNKTVNEMNWDGFGDDKFLLIKDFDDYIDEEVYAGRITNVIPENPAGVMRFITSDTYVREKTGIEGPYYLKFSDSKVNPDKYTGIGDLGILGSNKYFIYNGMLFNENIEQIGTDDTWTDVGATHAVSDTYFTPAINNGKLVYLKDNEVFDVKRSSNYKAYPDYIYHDQIEVQNLEDDMENRNLESTLLRTFDESWVEISEHWIEDEASSWEIITGYVNEYYTAFGVCNGNLYKIFLEDGQVVYELINEGNWKYITGSYYPHTYNCYGIQNNKLYIINDTIQEVQLDGEELIGWDPTFDCISRYDHANDEYITYGICNHKLYAICNGNITLLDNGNWTAICGYYNNNSPRTFGYGIKDGALYELQGNDIVLKDNTKTWTDITGCTTATNNFVLGIANNNLYKINAKTLSLIDEGGWTDVFGRFTTSTSQNANCYGYGIKDGRLHVLHINEDIIVPGMWKLNGEGKPVDLNDYNITDITVDVDGHIITGIDEVRVSVPIADEPASNYDIYVSYDTIGFEDNQRYQVKTEMSREYNTYINPETCRDNIYMDNAPEFDTETSYLTNFTECPLIKHGTQKINGDGEAYEFAFHKSYLEIPRLYYEIIDEHGFERQIEKPLDQFKVKTGCIIDDKFRPLILTANGDGIFYGFFNNQYGIFLNDTRIIPVAQNDHKEFYIRWIKGSVQDKGTLAYSFDNITYTNCGTMERPVYLGGNEETQNSEEPGDGIFFLSEGYITYDYENTQYDVPHTVENYPLYKSGKYLSVDTLGLDTTERIISDGNQENQKVIEIQDLDKNPIIEFGMDKMYVSRKFETNSNLNITDNFCYNKLNIGETEETTKSTLIYSGEYTLDPEKAMDIGNIHDTYKKDTIAKNFTQNDYIKYNPNEILEFTTGNNVESQLLLSTEEHQAYTNQYLLQADLTARYNNTNLTRDKKKQKHVVPSGVIYEENTQKPGTVTKTLEYNSESFEIDESKIQCAYLFTFDSYNAILSGFQPIPEMDTYCTIPLQGDPLKPILKLHLNTARKEKVMMLGEEDIVLGNIDQVERIEKQWFDSNMTLIEVEEVSGHYVYNDMVLTEVGTVEIDETTYTEYEGREETEDHEIILHTFYELDRTVYDDVIDGTVYPWESNKDYWLKTTIDRIDTGIQYITLHETTSTEPKDKFIIGDGLISNFSNENYIITPTLRDKKELVIHFAADDDISKDQGLFGLTNGQSVCIKDNHLCLCDRNGNILERATYLIDNGDDFLLRFYNDGNNLTEAKVYITDGEEYPWEQLFESKITIQNNMFIGYADTGVEPLSFNGTVNLARSYTNGTSLQRFYDYLQTTTIYISEDGVNYDTEKPIIIETRYRADDYFFGYDFTGTLDMYGSDLLLPYTLYWLENRTNVDTVIKQVKQIQDPTYDPELDPNTYSIKEYGIHIKNTPKRWDTITINYITEDKAYYMEPNTTYKLKCDVEMDENGKCLLTQVNNPTWNAGIVSFENGYYTWDCEGYLVLSINSNTEDQTLCSMNDGQKLCIKDGKWQFFDDTNYHEICEAGGDIIFKLKFDASKIEYNKGTWTESVEGFIGYNLTIGTGFNGTINLNESYIVTDHKQKLFTPYKRVTPYIYDGAWKPLTIEPMLTIDDVEFGKQFNGTLDLIASNLLKESTYWAANQINIYAKDDMPEDGIHKDELIKSVIRDNITIDTDKYWTDSEIVKVNPEDLDLIVEGLPLVDNTITLTYDTWYMFRENEHEYDFNIIYGDRAQFSYTDIETGKTYIIYETDPQKFLFNTGYNFWGTISLKDSYRGGMMMCSYIVYNEYVILYRKYGEIDWMEWNRFSKLNESVIYQRIGFELNGPLYMESSYVKLGNLVSPFLAYWDGTYITIVGGPSIQDGIATNFSENDYLVIRENSIHDGDKVVIDVVFTNLEDQGIASGVHLKDNIVYFGDTALQKVYLNYKMIIEYTIENGKARLRVIGDNSTNFEFGKAKARTLTIIPYNQNLDELQSGHYVESTEDAEKLQVYYRVGDTYYDHFNPPILEWHPVALQKENIRYFGKDLDIYVAKVDLGYTYDIAGNPTNINPDGVKYNDNDDIEYKIVSPTLTSTNKTVLYADRLEKQRTEF